MSIPRPLRGEFTVGGDKSISHRTIMLAALVSGDSEISNLSRGADVLTTLELYRRLGLLTETANGCLKLRGGGVDSIKSEFKELYCGNSGTTLRLSMGILAGANVECKLLGDASLNRRPVKRVIEPLQKMGASLTTEGASDRPPVIVRGQRLHGGNINTDIASAQVKSAILLAGLNADGITSVTEPSKSRDHTEIMLRYLGCDIDVEGNTVILRPPKFLPRFEYQVPGDLSTAAFFIITALIVPGSEVVIQNVLLNPTRTGVLSILEAMGAGFTLSNEHHQHGEQVGDILVRSTQLHSFDTTGIPTASFIDEVPILAVAAMFAQGETVFRGISELRVKESDRAQAILDVLRSYGGEGWIEGEDLHVMGGSKRQHKSAEHGGDHRIAMMIEVINYSLHGTLHGGFEDVISVSAPEFYHTFHNVVK